MASGLEWSAQCFFFFLLFFFFFPAERSSLLPSQIYRNDRGKNKGGKGCSCLTNSFFFLFLCSFFLQKRTDEVGIVPMQADRFLWPIDQRAAASHQNLCTPYILVMIHHHCASVPHKSPDGVHLVCPKEAAATFFALFLYSLSNDVNSRAEGEREIADRCHPPSQTNQSLHKQLICFPRVYADLTCPTYRIKNNV